MIIVSVPCVLTPRLTIGTTSSTSAAHSSNLQLIRVELPTRDSTKKIDKSCNEKTGKPRFHNLVSELKVRGRVGTKIGEEKSQRTNVVDRATRTSTIQDDHWTSRQSANSREKQSKHQNCQGGQDKSSAMKTVQRKFIGRSR